MGAPRDLASARIRTKVEAKILDVGAADTHRKYGERLGDVIGAMQGTVVELGPGTGANMRYFADGVKVIGIEPNPGMHGHLREQADEHDVDYEIRTLRGEALDVADGSADGVVSTLVLCGVDDPDAVIGEVLRVLKPGGRFVFLEHVAAPEGTKTRVVQNALLRPHRWMFNGCEVNRDTATLLRGAGFSDLELTERDEGPAGIYLRHRIVGVATK
jgi:ubiquinone/menaquinone biosynthesis C-methylase UbiE